MRVLRHLLVFAHVLALAPPAAAQVQPALALPCDRNTLLVLRADDRPWPPASYALEIAPGGDAPRRVAEGLPVSSEDWTFLTARFPEPFPTGAEALRVAVRADGALVAEGTFSTKAGATVRPSRAEDEAHYRFEVLSQTPIARPTEEQRSRLQLIEVLSKPQQTIQGEQEIPEKVMPHPVDLVFPTGPGGCASPITGGEQGKTAGGAVVDLRPGDRLRDGSVGLRLVGLSDIFGQDLVATGPLAPAKIPKGKDDAALYTKVLFESAKGSADAYSLDLRVRPQLRMRGRWLFQPEVNAYLAKGVPGATESIRLSALFSHTTVRQDRLVMAQTFSFGPAVHSDRDFEPVNALLDLRWRPDFKGQYRPRENRRYAYAAEHDKRLDEVALPLFGFGFDAYLALEAGRTVRIPEGTGQDHRDVLRLRPHLHGFVEVGRLTLDLSSSLRYLLVEETGGAEGFHPYTEATLSLAFDSAKHLALAVSYKKGSEPPLFVDVDRYSAGIVAKY